MSATSDLQKCRVEIRPAAAKAPGNLSCVARCPTPRSTASVGSSRAIDARAHHHTLFIVLNSFVAARELRGARVNGETEGNPGGSQNMETAVVERIRDLETLHRSLDVAVSRLGRRAYLTPSEQREMLELKKQKLQAKDQLAALRRMGD